MAYNIKHLLSISASIQSVYEALTTSMGIRNWWTDNADLDETIGGNGIFRFHYEHTVETVVEIIQLKKFLICWRVLTSFRPEQEGTIIMFQLHPQKSHIMLHFSQSGFVAEDETYAMMNTGWAYYLVSLKQYVETGKGAPSPHVDFSILV
jgi:uncharacterized protein YndB with AHSA1/START domain